MDGNTYERSLGRSARLESGGSVRVLNPSLAQLSDFEQTFCLFKRGHRCKEEVGETLLFKKRTLHPAAAPYESNSRYPRTT
ncbi:MAG: hypothetical protein ACJATN_000983 [Neolewinella sp.]